MAGFFTLKDLGFDEPEKKAAAKFEGGCDSCDLHCGCENVEFCGKGSDGILILAGYPTKAEDNSENCFVSPLYDPLFNLQGKRGVPDRLMESCWFGYAVPTNLDAAQLKNPKRPQCCISRLRRMILKLKPKVIICLGSIPTNALIVSRLSGRMKGMQSAHFYGKQIPDREFNCWICPTYSPECFNWREFKEDRCVKMYFEQHVRSAFRIADKKLPVIPKDIKTTENPHTAAVWIDSILRAAEPGPDHVIDVAIDYETTGLKPHRDGHEIKVSSVAWRSGGEYHAIGFRWDPDNEEMINAWYRLTHHDRVKLIAHKCDYEACWTRFRAGLHSTRVHWIPDENWSWDTCVAAHVIDNVQKVGLKFHTYCEFGVLGYDADADQYLKPRDDDPTYGESANAFNGLKSDPYVPWLDICSYCAQDSLYTIMLRDIQDEQLTGKLREAYRFLLDSTIALAEVQSEGFPIDLSKFDEVRKHCEEEEEHANVAVMNSEEVAKWNEVKGTPFNPDSNPQLKELLYDILKLDPPQGVKDTTADTLDLMGTQFCQDILTLRKWKKILGTFLEGYKREAVWDEEKQLYLVRPFFNLATGSGDSGGPRTYRSSSDSPNFQNIPKRDKVMKKALRSLFVAPPGWRYMECDYTSLEVMISASYHHDPNMIKYLQDPSSNMHTDTACDMYIRDHSVLTKEERNSIKAGFVFSQFYGSSWKSCAQGMWYHMPDYTKKHLMEECGITTYEKWEAHVKKAADIFWNERFRVYNQWRKREWEKYQENGYLETYIGFRCNGPMTTMQSGNCCIQGTGAHCLLWGLRENRADFKAAGLQSRIIGEIHDSQVILVKDEEVQQVASIVWKNSVKRCMEHFPWIAVPLKVEADVADGSRCWANMEEAGQVAPEGLPGFILKEIA